MLQENKKIFYIFILMTCVLILSGCWDRREIERNAFILGVAIDAAEEEKIRVTFEIAIPQAFGGGESSGNMESTLDITITAEDMADATASLLKKIDRVPDYTHLQLLVFGEEYARKGIKKNLDFFFRAPNIRYRTNIAVALGEGKKILDFKPKTAKASSMYISDIISQNSSHNFEIFQFQNIGTLQQNDARKSPIFLSQVALGPDTIDISGGGVFKDYKLIGWFSGKEVQGQRWVWEQVGKGGNLRIEMPQDKGGKIALDIFNSKSSLIPILKDNKIIAQNTIYIEGDLLDIENPNISQNPNKLIVEWEKAFEDYVHKSVHNSFIKGRDVFGVDNFEIDGKMADYHPKYWKEHRDQWNQIFKTVELVVDVDVRIRRVGSIKP